MDPRYRPAALLFVVLLTATPALASDDFQYWPRVTLNTFEREPWSLSTYGEVRLIDDASEAGLYQVSEKLAYRAAEWLDLGLNYTYISQETANRDRTTEFKYQHRAELELNPHWRAGDSMNVKNRNRFEFRWIEDQGSDHARFRQLWELSFPIKGLAPLKAFFVNSEYFYDFNRERIAENRAIPAGIDIRLNDRASLKVFYMVQSRRGASDWSSNQVVGTHLTVDF